MATKAKIEKLKESHREKKRQRRNRRRLLKSLRTDNPQFGPWVGGIDGLTPEPVLNWPTP